MSHSLRPGFVSLSRLKSRSLWLTAACIAMLASSASLAAASLAAAPVDLVMVAPSDRAAVLRGAGGALTLVRVGEEIAGLGATVLEVKADRIVVRGPDLALDAEARELRAGAFLRSEIYLARGSEPSRLRVLRPRPPTPEIPQILPPAPGPSGAEGEAEPPSHAANAQPGASVS